MVNRKREVLKRKRKDNTYSKSILGIDFTYTSVSLISDHNEFYI